MALPIVIFSVLGDLIESAIKRHLNVKDAGDLLPGHGGLLDRVDSLMLAVLVSALALMFWPDIWPMINAK
jgi:phosphatidate cytidylyltransferase